MDCQKASCDWNCRSCHHLNFGYRDFCHKCGDLKSELVAFEVKPGDWYCFAGGCGAHNYRSRSTCYKCGAFKDEAVAGGGCTSGNVQRQRSGGVNNGGRPSWKSGDWLCARDGCNEHNFASRIECYKCGAPKLEYINLQPQYH